MAERYRMLPDLVRIPVGEGAGLACDLFAAGAADAQLLDAESMGMLSRCARFATLEEHAQRIARSVRDAAEPAAIERRLGELARMGLLASERGLREALRAAADDVEPPGATSSIGIPTCGRPELLAGCISSYAAATGERELEIVVADDARDDAEAGATQEALAALSPRPGLSLRYAGPAEKARYAEVLAARTELRPELVQFAIAPGDPEQIGTGANRNALLLHHAGSLALQVDDDTRADIAPLGSAEAGLVVNVRGGPQSYWFPDPGADADSLRDCEPLDPCALHERALGRTVRACIAAESGELDVGGVTGQLLHRLRQDPGRVLCSQLGIAGDAATGSLAHYLLLVGKSRQRLHCSEAHYQHAIASRQVMRGVTATTLTDTAFCMSFALGLDHRELLPPFAPLGRNSDGMFGLVLHRCFRDGYSALLPFTVAHRPPPRDYSREAMLAQARRLSSNDLVVRLVAASDIHAPHADPRDNLSALGDHLLRLGTLDTFTFEGMMRQTLMRTRGEDLRQLRGVLAGFQQHPSYWAADVQALIDTLSDAVTRPDHSRPVDLEQRFGPAAAPEAFQRRLRLYGELLHHWPSLFDAARQLREEGVRMGRLL